MKKFSINCDFGGQMAPFDFYIGRPEKEHHPLHFQADWLSKQRNGVVPPEVMTAIAKLKEIAEKNNVSLEDLCVYAIGSADQKEEDEGETQLSPAMIESVESTNLSEINKSDKTTDSSKDLDRVNLEKDVVDDIPLDELEELLSSDNFNEWETEEEEPQAIEKTQKVVKLKTAAKKIAVKPKKPTKKPPIKKKKKPDPQEE